MVIASYQPSFPLSSYPSSIIINSNSSTMCSRFIAISIGNTHNDVSILDRLPV
jgi:hypothetical protein